MSPKQVADKAKGQRGPEADTLDSTESSPTVASSTTSFSFVNTNESRPSTTTTSSSGLFFKKSKKMTDDKTTPTNHHEDEHKDKRGRPSHDLCHKEPKLSLLSHRNKSVNLKGFFNLICLILIAQNARLVIENSMKYGLLIKPITIPSGVHDLIENWPILLSLILMHGAFIAAFFLEKYLNPILNKTSKIGTTWLSAIITSCNALLVLYIPYITISVHNGEPLSASALVAFSITWFFKLWSFHHVMFDIRYSLSHKNSLLYVFVISCSHGEEYGTEHLGGEKASKYPHSLLFKEFYIYLLMPTMCYQFEYPRTSKIRWLSLFRHAIEMTLCLLLMKILIEQYMVIIVQNTFLPIDELLKMKILNVFAHLSERILKLSVPNLYVWLLMFVALFHHWLNILAEITHFADREFYKDWWNSGSFEEYWRKWNLPIHNFFNRHINKPLLRQKVPRLIAGQVVFIISAVAHEYMVCVPLHVGWTGLVFTAFIAQVPLVYITSLRFFQDHPTFGNIIFWISFCFTGQPLAIIVYYYLWGVHNGAVMEMNVKQIQQLVETQVSFDASSFGHH